MSGRLRRSPAYVISKVLIELDIVNVHTSLTWPIFVTNEPDSPDNAVIIRNTAGMNIGRIQNDGSNKELHGINVKVRARNSEDLEDKANEIAVAFDKQIIRYGITVDGRGYCVHLISRTGGPPLFMGKDVPNTQRHWATVNALVSIDMDE
jgi:hypothetical protein